MRLTLQIVKQFYVLPKPSVGPHPKELRQRRASRLDHRHHRGRPRRRPDHRHRSRYHRVPQNVWQSLLR